jgi:hypothetical protein
LTDDLVILRDRPALDDAFGIAPQASAASESMPSSRCSMVLVH